MINIVIAVDEKDAELGGYFKMCAADMIFELQNPSHTDKYKVITLRTDELTAENIQRTALLAGDDNYIFVAYSHGNEECLGVVDAELYVDLEFGVEHFCKSLFYTFSCKSATILGPSLVAAGCHVFWGYREDAEVMKPFESLFLECTNHGLKVFLMGEAVEDAFDSMMNKFDEAITYLYKINFYACQALMHNRDSLIFIGNNKLKLSDIL